MRRVRSVRRLRPRDIKACPKDHCAGTTVETFRVQWSYSLSWCPTMTYRSRPPACESAASFAAATTASSAVSAAPPVIAVVTRVVDGNTLDVVTSHHGQWAQWRVRVRGVVVPRLTAQSRTERYVAHAAIEYVRGLIHGRTVALANQGYDRFGRSVGRDGAPAPYARRPNAVAQTAGPPVRPWSWSYATRARLDIVLLQRYAVRAWRNL